MTMKSRALSLALRHGLPALVLAYVFLILLVPLSDPDLFWHLATGKRIVETGELPGREDLFAYTSPRVLSEGQVEGLRSQWLGQVAFYSVYALGGYPGLIIFRNLLIVLPFVVAYVISARKGLGPAWALPVLLLPTLLITFSLYYAFERPQAFTVLLSFALVPLLLRLRRREGRWPWVALLAAMMALWSNLHGGFIFGAVMVAAFAFGVLAEAAIKRRKEDAFIVVPAAIGIGASLLNPNGPGLLYGFLRGHISRLISGPPAPAGPAGRVDVVGQLLEYKPLWYFYRELHLVWPLFMMVFIALAASMLLVRYAAQRSLRLHEALLAASIAAFSLYYSRGATVALVALPLFLVSSAAGLGRLWRLASGAVAAALCAALLVITVQRSPWQLEPRARPASLVEATYPEGAVRFIREENIRGPMFNDFGWGGYLIWSLYPEQKVFVDGRIVSGEVVSTYMFVVNAVPGAMRELDAFGVNFILMRVISEENGAIAPLILKFIEEKPAGWKLVYTEGNCVLFLRDTEANRRVVEKYSLPVEVLNGPIYAGAAGILQMVPGHPNAGLSMGIALAGLERYDEAEKVLMSLPTSPARDKYLARIERARGRNDK